MKKKVIIIVSMLAVIILLHSTPRMALRTHVFFWGYPKADSKLKP
ncbi:hypothetical protein ACFVT8_07085 [Lysinibacillus sp. NPDC058147]